AVGSDLGCGMAAVRFAASSDLLSDAGRAADLLEALYRRVPSNRHPRSEAPARLPDLLEDRPLSAASLEKEKRRDARVQLGTLGRGNHFVEFQADEEERLWLMVHSGSRGIGERLAGWHAIGHGAPWSKLGGVEAESPGGQDYLSDLAWAIDYARASRR